VELAVSRDGTEFTPVDRVSFCRPEPGAAVGVRDAEFALPSGKIRWLRMNARNLATCPSWSRGSGGKAWVFVDEFIVR
jgi:hypothetical protein